MKAKFTISISTSSDGDDDNYFMAFVISSSIINPPIIA